MCGPFPQHHGSARQGRRAASRSWASSYLTAHLSLIFTIMAHRRSATAACFTLEHTYHKEITSQSLPLLPLPLPRRRHPLETGAASSGTSGRTSSGISPASPLLIPPASRDDDRPAAVDAAADATSSGAVAVDASTAAVALSLSMRMVSS